MSLCKGAFVITHGSLAAQLEAVVTKIAGSVEHLYAFSNQTAGLEELEKEISAVIIGNKMDEVRVFVDLIGGSCWLLANKLKKQFPYITILSGVNLPMLVSYKMNYQRAYGAELNDKLIADAVKGITAR